MAGTETRIADRYVLGPSIGRGGMGEVWRARDTLLDREVAVKAIQLPPSLSPEETDATKERVLREARAAARINHSNAVTVYDVFEEGGRAYIVMELIDAPTLADKVSDEGPLGAEDAARIGLEVLGALEAAHREGITHRDVKPSNVMLPPGGVKLADFGIASISDDPRLTETGLVLGSPSYMAPEQATSDRPGPPTDMWALGAMLYYAVEGKPPFDKGHSIATLTAVVHEDLPQPQAAGPLAELITDLLAKEPSQRPGIATTRARLARVAAGEATTVASGAPETTPYTNVSPPAPRPAPAPRPDERAATAPSRRGFPWAVVLGILALLALVAALVIPNLSGDGEPAEERSRSEAGGGAGDEDTTGGGTTDGEAAPDEGSLNVYEDPTTGYQIEYPEGWDVQPIDTRTDFTDPETGSYLRIDHTDTPGPDALAAAEAQSDDFGATHDCYEELAMEPTSMSGSDNAVLWEYVYCEGGADLHAYNLQFVLSDGSYGFALNFQTHEEDWEASLGLWEGFKSSFRPPEA